MKVIETTLPGVLLLEPRVFSDDRGFFMETYHAARFAEIGISLAFIQDNHSYSIRNVLRGLHYQEPNAQGKLVRAVTGTIFDVAVDIRRGSPTFARWFGTELSEGNKLQLWVPPGFAHGFCVLSETSDVVYKCTTLYDGAADRSILWNDPQIGIEWPVDIPLLSAKDAAAPRLSEASLLPSWQKSR
ncbi:MAG TPA: dTDP-4-dehydrorhamnose 3,5-epimerase [Thermoanaerobaculia bacterium]|nr:dTDP-4-dehydrorhamnose 3,5-epimerase [Thermoanaerobaculia bacterium]